MSTRVRRPEVQRLELTQGDWILVKKYLTAGEYRALIQSSTKPIEFNAAKADLAPADLARRVNVQLDAISAGLETVLAYLLDWSFEDADGRPLVIADQPPAVVRAALDAIDAESYMEVQRAIQVHQKTVAGELEAQKKIPTGVPRSNSTLISVGS